jgi:two-component system cell cycle sensor histidine kinase/response regulator CckA
VTTRAQATIRGSVLVVDDQSPIRSLVTRLLERCGFRVTAFGDAREALAYAENDANEFNVLLTDVVMPEVGGRALSDAIRTRRPQVPIVFMSGHTDDTIVRHGIQEAREYFIAKPFTQESLTRVLCIALERAQLGLTRPGSGGFAFPVSAVRLH